MGVDRGFRAHSLNIQLRIRRGFCRNQCISGSHGVGLADHSIISPLLKLIKIMSSFPQNIRNNL